MPLGHWRSLTFLAVPRHDRIDAAWMFDEPCEPGTRSQDSAVGVGLAARGCTRTSPPQVVRLDNRTCISTPGHPWNQCQLLQVRLAVPFGVFAHRKGWVRRQGGSGGPLEQPLHLCVITIETWRSAKATAARGFWLVKSAAG